MSKTTSTTYNDDDKIKTVPAIHKITCKSQPNKFKEKLRSKNDDKCDIKIMQDVFEVFVCT